MLTADHCSMCLRTVIAASGFKRGTYIEYCYINWNIDACTVTRATQTQITCHNQPPLPPHP